MQNKANQFGTSKQKLDIKLLERLLLETTIAIDRNGANVAYYIPLKAEFIDTCDFIFKKYGIKMERYQSSLAPYPLLKISLAQIQNLPQQTRDFLFSIYVSPRQLDARYREIMSEMQKQK